MSSIADGCTYHKRFIVVEYAILDVGIVIVEFCASVVGRTLGGHDQHGPGTDGRDDGHGHVERYLQRKLWFSGDQGRR